MKHLFQILFLIVVTFNSYGQTEPPTPPEPPKRILKGSISSSTSINETNKSLSFKANWSNKSKYDKLKIFLINRLGEEGLSINGNTYKWSRESDAFNCTLNSKSLKLNLDYDEASISLANQIDDMMDNLKYAMGSKPEDELKRAQKELERAKLEVEKAKRDIERAKRELKRKQGNRINRTEILREGLEKRKVERELAMKERKKVLELRREEVIKKRVEQKEKIKTLKQELEKLKEKELKEKEQKEKSN